MKIVQIIMASCLLVISINSFSGVFSDIKQQAESGNALAQAKIGAMYQLGRNGVDKDAQESARWMRKAADQNMVEAQVFMALRHSLNLATPYPLKSHQLTLVLNVLNQYLRYAKQSSRYFFWHITKKIKPYVHRLRANSPLG
jgi:TPR repeat protein